MAEKNFFWPTTSLPSVQSQDGKKICYAYVTTELLAFLLAKESNPPAPLRELSVKELAYCLHKEVEHPDEIVGEDKIWPATTFDYVYTYITKFGLSFKADCDFEAFEDFDNKICEPPLSPKLKVAGWTTLSRKTDNPLLYHGRTVRYHADMEPTPFEIYQKTFDEEFVEMIIRRHVVSGSLSICASFEDYNGEGIYFGPKEGEGEVTGAGHTVVIYGYGEENGVAFYHVKNSWGRWWGNRGFGKVLRSLIYEITYPHNDNISVN